MDRIKLNNLFHFQCDTSHIVLAMHRMKKHKSRKLTATKTATRFIIFQADFCSNVLQLGGCSVAGGYSGGRY
jgi:hypothetical protein